MKYSFIVPVCDDIRVINTIQSFLDCSGSEIHECLIVCNGSSSKTLELLLERNAGYKNIRIVYTKKKNISLARNIGVLQARGEFLVFIDSDCVFDDNYLKNLIRTHNKQDVIKGKIDYTLGRSAFDRNYSWLRTYFNDNYKLSPYTPNLIINKKIYNKVGLYNEELSGAEDSEWSQRFKEYNEYNLVYSPNLSVSHGLDDAKKSQKTWMLYGIGRAYQVKKAKLFYGNSVLLSLQKTFSELSLIDVKRPLNQNIFILRYAFYKSVGFIYGWIVKWSKYTKQKYISTENYLKSENYKIDINKSTKNVK